MYSDYASFFLTSDRQSSTLKARHYYSQLSLPPAFTVGVDLGCGTGSNRSVLELFSFQTLYLVDQLIQEEIPHRHQDIRYVKSDILDFLLSLQSSSIDVIALYDVLEHLDRESISTITRECFRVLKQGGVVLIQVPNASSPFHGQIYYADPTHQTPLNSTALNYYLLRAGFHLENITHRECYPPPVRFFWIIRFVLYQILCFPLRLFLLAETGSSDHLMSRVIYSTAKKA